jgi:hypothetical protein
MAWLAAGGASCGGRSLFHRSVYLGILAMGTRQTYEMRREGGGGKLLRWMGVRRAVTCCNRQIPYLHQLLAESHLGPLGQGSDGGGAGLVGDGGQEGLARGGARLLGLLHTLETFLAIVQGRAKDADPTRSSHLADEGRANAGREVDRVGGAGEHRHKQQDTDLAEHCGGDRLELLQR